MSAAPKISVVVTCYNLGRYLDEAVDSVLAQTFQDFEILIVDDGSTDPATVELLSDYSRPKTRVIRIENRGLSGARNEGIRQTTGPYVCTLDADDLLEQTYFEKAVSVLDQDPTVFFVSHWFRTFGDEEWEWKPESADFPSLLDRNTVNGAALVRRDALLAIGLFDESLRQGCEDWDLWISMVEHGFRGVILPEILFFYRRRADSMSRVMFHGPTYTKLLAYLIEKHRPSFEAHLLPLLVRRESDRVIALREVHDLELDCEAELRPEIARLREAVRAAKHKLELREHLNSQTEGAERLLQERNSELERVHQHLAGVAAERERLGRLVAERDSELERAGERIAAAEAEGERLVRLVTERSAELEAVAGRAAAVQAELEQERHGIVGLKREIGMLRGSLSWRLTTPLRAVYTWLFERERT